jgi:hypothetical protein
MFEPQAVFPFGRTTGTIWAICSWSVIALLVIQVTAGALHLFQHTVHKRQVLVRPLLPVQNLQGPHDLTMGQGTFE